VLWARPKSPEFLDALFFQMKQQALNSEDQVELGDS
jgi:hypothetical protein